MGGPAARVDGGGSASLADCVCLSVCCRWLASVLTELLAVSLELLDVVAGLGLALAGALTEGQHSSRAEQGSIQTPVSQSITVD